MQRTGLQKETMRWSVALLALLVASGCSLNRMKQPQIERLGAEVHTPRPPEYPIAITEGDYREPYIRIAQATTAPFDDRTGEALGQEELRRLTRELGGDAVVRVTRKRRVVEEKTYRPWFIGLTMPSTRFVDMVALTGIVVRFERETDALALPLQNASETPPEAAKPE